MSSSSQIQLLTYSPGSSEEGQHPNPWSNPATHLAEVQALRARGHSFLPFEAVSALAGEGGTAFLLEQKVEGRLCSD